MNILSIITACLIVTLALHEFNYRRTRIVPTIRSTADILSACIGIIVILFVAVFFAHSFLHYLMIPFGILFMITDITKQGLSRDGILIIARGKELYPWSEIHHVEIDTTDRIKITYHTDSISIVQYYRHEYKAQIMTRLQNHHIPIRYSQSSR